MAYRILPLPAGLKPHETVGLKELSTIVEQQPEEIVAHFRSHPELAKEVLQQCGDKRYTPGTFIGKVDGGYQVGWFTRDREYVQRFSELEEAAADYVLFSFGKGRLVTSEIQTAVARFRGWKKLSHFASTDNGRFALGASIALLVYLGWILIR